MFNEMSKKDIVSRIAFSYLGTAYKWGGDDPMAGFDCSGFVIELLKSVGILPRKGDWTAQSLWHLLYLHRLTKLKNVREGCLVFWFNRKGDRYIHVEYCINEHLSIGASGGGSRTKTTQDAINQNAYIKIRPINSRKGKKSYVFPF